MLARVVLADVVAQRERRGDAQADARTPGQGVMGPGGLWIVACRKQARIARERCTDGAVGHQLGLPRPAGAFVAHGGVDQRHTGDSARQQTPSLRRPIGPGANGMDGERDVAARHGADCGIELDRKVEIRVGEQVAAPDDDGIALRKLLSEMTAQHQRRQAAQRQPRAESAQPGRKPFEGC